MLFGGQLMAQKFQKTDFGIKTTVQSNDVEVQFFSPSTVRIVKSPTGHAYTKKSLSVTKQPKSVKLSVNEKDNEILIKSDKMALSLNLNTGKIAYSTLAGKTLLVEKENSTKFTDFNDAGTKAFKVYQAFTLESDEAIYGLGQHQNGKMEQRNLSYYMVQGNIEDVIPFFQSNKGYGLYWDNYSPTTFTDNKDETSFNSEVGDCVDYYFMYGGNADGVIAQMRDLTGQAPMFPLWTLGFWQSRERYKSQAEVVGVVKKFRELGVPLDGIIQDWQYWGDNYHWNAMEFLNPQFPNPKQMLDDVHNMNAHMIISAWASFGPQTQIYKDLDAKGMLFNFKTWPVCGIDVWPPDPKYPSGVRVYDAYNPEARDIYWKYMNKGIFSLGMDGWWLDSTEPDHFDIQDSDYDTQTYLGSFRKVRNAFPLMTVGGVYEHQRATQSDKRVFILTRSAFAGQQRYGANTWSGDVVASWDALRNQISAGLNFSLCGIPYWNCDLGGFFLWNFKNPLENPDYRELHVRWIEFGTFCPMMRSHGEGSPREIYQFGQKGNPTYDAIEKYIKLRYSLLPYMYSTSWEVTANQSSMMRALVMDFATDKKALNINDEYMFGKSLLVNPVTNSMYLDTLVNGKDTTKVANFGKIKTKATYLPEGADWFDFWNNTKFTGGQTVNKETPIDIIPVYVKAGAILPIGPSVQYATEKKWDELEIRVYPGADGEFTLYEDENDNYNYETGSYSTILFKWNDKDGKLTIGERKGKFAGMLVHRKFNIKLISNKLNTQTDKIIEYDGKQLVVKL
jgi:alpha-D-xyloside xylohydrolase